jgi:D-alanyl-lipoteichoic acid acyltransferase DltB (MBOAT superfamily)
VAFNSPEYLVFYVAVLGLSWLVFRLPRVRVWLLLLASYYFYASNNHWILILLLISTMIDYLAGIMIEDSRSARSRWGWLVASLCSNLGMLGFFKYFNFFADNVAALGRVFGVHLGWTELNIFLPAGISFYTFESMSYVIDVYRGELRPEHSWPRYACFVAFFPHLIAGPIVRPGVFFPQLDRKTGLERRSFDVGLFLIFQGLFKKVVLADFLATFADAGFDHPAQASALTAVLAAYAFTLQIYFDFAGYTDLAIGCSKLMGIDLPDNFRRPYVSSSITEFWRRWHISLSTWLRDYLYIPLGGNRMRTRFGIERNLMITMLLGGLWHGAAWHFVLWGGLQGIFLVIERRLGIGRGHGAQGWSAGRWLGILITFHLTCFSWILFRANDMHAFLEFLRALGRFEAPANVTLGMAAGAAIALGGWAVQVLGERIDIQEAFLRWPLPARTATYAAIGTAVTVLGSQSAKPFIYFQF